MDVILSGGWSVRFVDEAVKERLFLPDAERNAVRNAIQNLEVMGLRLSYPHSSSVQGFAGLRELRPRAGRSPWRALYGRIGRTFVIAAIGPEAECDRRGFDQAARNAVTRLSAAQEGWEMPKLSEMASAEEIHREDMRNHAYRAEYERTAFANAVAIRVLKYRTDRGLSQSALARELGMQQPAIARLEAGDHQPSLEMLARLARTLGLEFHIDITPEAVHLRETA